ncbi:MAG: O-antigen acetylase [uncultured bacterium]|nr:MAG: O-antigen acetylase [uncultured bacterium]
MVWVGLISYPLYLWHWPLLSFATIMETRTPSPAIRMTAIALAFMLAWSTYFFIERPIRFGRRSRTKVSALVLPMILLAGLGSVAYLKGNVRSSTLTAGVVDQIARLDFALHFAKWSPCPNEADTWNCKILNPDKPAEIALIGDSHSVHLASGLAELETVADRNIISRNGNGCLPVFELEVGGMRYYDCEDDVINKGLEEAIHSESVKEIMLSGYAVWRIRPIDDDLHLEEVSEEEVNEHAAILEKALHITLSRLVASGKKIIFFVDTPVLDFEPTECTAMRPLYLNGHTSKDPCALPRPLFEQRNAEYHRIIKSAQKTFPTVEFINLYDTLCDQDLCYAQKDGVLLYRDHSHLSADGSRYVFSKIEDELHL